MKINEDFDRETNAKIQEVVNEMLSIYYGEFDKKRLGEIVSEELLGSITTEDKFSRFREQRNVFSVDPSSMQTLSHSINNEGNDFFI